MSSYEYGMAMLNDLFFTNEKMFKQIGIKTSTGSAVTAYGKGLKLRTIKGDQPWHRVIEEKKGVAVHKTPLPGHSLNGYLDNRNPPVLVVNNAVPESRQEVTMVKLVLEMEFRPNDKQRLSGRNVEATIGAYAATCPEFSDKDRRDSYLDENPEMREVSEGLKVAAVTLVAIAGIIMLVTGLKGVARCLKGV